ncbi:MAG: hypothetical protein QNJ41_10120 [Xenococcaceae cyanobacterium MO_188.B32]|nr:hypothetical protein [Xenococcaceae cyanobacterium MO_188.B32]
MEILPSLQTERIESFKAGMLAAIFFVFAEFAITIFNICVLPDLGEQLISFNQSWGVNLLIRGGIAWISGFLFGVTYRYIIRGDRNSHLNDGAVLAFGLVRGLVFLEETTIFWSSSILVIESILCFAIARLSLDLALRYKLIKPFIT